LGLKSDRKEKIDWDIMKEKKEIFASTAAAGYDYRLGVFYFFFLNIQL